MIEAGPDKLRVEFMKWAVSKVEEKGAPKSGAAAKSEKADVAPIDVPEEEAAETEAEAPKTVRKPRRLGFKAPESETDAPQDENENREEES
jgi:hypothetical protein